MAGTRERYNYSIFLNAVQSPVNIGRVTRTCEVFQINLGIFDPKNVMADPEKRKTVSDFSCGALDRTKFTDTGDLTDRDNLLQLKKRGRLIATCVGQAAVELPDFVFEENDMVVVGNEYDGLSQDFIDVADVKLFIPMPEVYVPKPKSFYPIDPERQARDDVAQNGLANLSASTTVSIITYCMYLQARQT